MTVLYFQQQNMVMVRIPKTGGTSIVNGVFGGVKNAALKVRGTYPSELSEVPSFSVVRNPFDRLVSAYLMFRDYPVSNQNEADFRNDLTLARLLSFMKDSHHDIHGKDYFSKLYFHTVTQSSTAFPLEKVDNIYKFENFGDAYREVYLNALKEPCNHIPHLRQSQRASYRDYFDKSTQAAAEELFENDCKSFGYAF